MGAGSQAYPSSVQRKAAEREGRDEILTVSKCPVVARTGAGGGPGDEDPTEVTPHPLGNREPGVELPLGGGCPWVQTGVQSGRTWVSSATFLQQ